MGWGQGRGDAARTVFNEQLPSRQGARNREERHQTDKSESSHQLLGSDAATWVLVQTSGLSGSPLTLLLLAYLMPGSGHS